MRRAELGWELYYPLSQAFTHQVGESARAGAAKGSSAPVGNRPAHHRAHGVARRDPGIDIDPVEMIVSRMLAFDAGFVIVDAA